MHYFFRYEIISASLCALLLFAAANSLAGSTDPVPDEVKQSVTVSALRTERGVKPRRVEEHVVTHVFWVQSQASLLNLSCVISDLKISETKKSAGLSVNPLEADISRGCRIEVPGAIATIGGGQFKLAQFSTEKYSSHGGQESDYVTFQTQDNSAFEQDVYVTVYWTQKSPMQLSGTYEGAVKLIAKIPNDVERPQ